jgi:hypothetical protein
MDASINPYTEKVDETTCDFPFGTDLPQAYFHALLFDNGKPPPG